MTWVKLDDGFVRHPRMVAAGLHGRALFIAGLCYCGAHLTDGRIPKAAVPMLAAEAGVKQSVAGKLVEVGSWIDRGDAYEVHDFLVYNPARAKVLGDREASAERQRKARESRVSRREVTRDKRRTSAVTSDVPARPVQMVPTEPSPALEPPARRVARLHWEAVDPKPAVKFIALVKIVERFLEAGRTEAELLAALPQTRAYTVDSIEFTLNQSRDTGSKKNGHERTLANLRKALTP